MNLVKLVKNIVGKSGEHTAHNAHKRNCCIASLDAGDLLVASSLSSDGSSHYVLSLVSLFGITVC